MLGAGVCFSTALSAYRYANGMRGVGDIRDQVDDGGRTGLPAAEPQGGAEEGAQAATIRDAPATGRGTRYVERWAAHAR